MLPQPNAVRLVVLPVLLTTVCGAAPGRDPAAQPSAGTIRGHVRVTNPVPAATLPVTTDRDACGRGVPDESLVVSDDGQVAHAVVVLEGDFLPAASEDRTLTNRGCRFVPHVQVAHPGDTLQITSDDDTLHTTHAYAENGDTLFNVAIPVPALTIGRPLTRPGALRLGCDSHSWMRAFVYVTSDWATVTGEDGSFEFEGVPAGTYTLRVWHERLESAPRDVTVSEDETYEVAFTLEP